MKNDIKISSLTIALICGLLIVADSFMRPTVDSACRATIGAGILLNAVAGIIGRK